MVFEDIQVTRKAEKLLSAEKQSRQVLDELDYLNEWFADARERLMNVIFSITIHYIIHLNAFFFLFSLIFCHFRYSLFIFY